MFGSLTLTLTRPLTLTCIYPLTLTFSLYRPHRHIPGVIVDVWLTYSNPNPTLPNPTVPNPNLTHYTAHTGIFLVSLSMFGSAGVPMVQEHCMSKYNASIEELLYHCYLGSTGDDLPHPILINPTNLLLSNPLPLLPGVDRYSTFHVIIIYAHSNATYILTLSLPLIASSFI